MRRGQPADHQLGDPLIAKVLLQPRTDEGTIDRFFKDRFAFEWGNNILKLGPFADQRAARFDTDMTDMDNRRIRPPPSVQ